MRFVRSLSVVAVLLGAALTPRAARAENDHEDARRAPVLQYGVGFTGEFVAGLGALCDPANPCIMGSGGGIAARLGMRSAGPFYFGGAYEVSKQDPSKLYRLALLQQVRAELRYAIETARALEPYFTTGLGAVGYGNEWRMDTRGGVAFAGGGVSGEIAPRTLVGLQMTYRAMYFSAFEDSTSVRRGGGFSHMVSVELTLEARDPVL